MVQLGTVLEGPQEWGTGARKTRRERRSRWLEEVMDDEKVMTSTRRRFLELQEKAQSIASARSKRRVRYAKRPGRRSRQ